ncbi:MAG TPA: MqnA/MqnD/SBP family protein [Thermomicrobiaceae bacterium]|nr:MqnA/MqnD/SBP family protein [Thermomicrobiaceae bacterium]
MTRCLIDDSLSTALLTYPLTHGWITVDGLTPVSDLRADAVEQAGVPAVLGSVDAAPLLDRYAVVTDLSFVSHHSGAIALWTEARPDEIEQTAIALDGVSRTAEALARATISHFYGVQVTTWERDGAEGDAVVREGVPALQPATSGHLGDLVRAWFILTGFPLPTHLLVVPQRMVDTEADVLASLVGDLRMVLAAGNERRRELRRNLADEFDLDRARLSELHAEQTTELSKTARKAWLDLLRRTGHAMKHPAVGEPVVVTVEGEE